MKQSIGIIGGGNMGEGLIKGAADQFIVRVAEKDIARQKYLRKMYKVEIGDVPGIVQSSNVVVLAVKPQDFEEVLAIVRNDVTKKTLIISIAAGITTRFIEKRLNKARVVRTMPNMPALIGEGITAVSSGAFATKSDVTLARRILAGLGTTVVVDEKDLDAVTAVSGSGPAYVFLFAEVMMSAARKMGLSSELSKQLVYSTLKGSTNLLEQRSEDAATLRQKVTSKGGTTQAALEVFQKGKFEALVATALKAAQKRAAELRK